MCRDDVSCPEVDICRQNEVGVNGDRRCLRNRAIFDHEHLGDIFGT